MMEYDKATISLGELREKYEKAIKNDVITIFIGDIEVSVSIINQILIDNSYGISDDTEIEVSQTNIFDDR